MIIADTSVISAFAAVKKLNLLNDILEKIHIPQGVFQEILESKEEKLIREVRKHTDLTESSQKLIYIQNTSNLMDEIERFKDKHRLGQGESEAIIMTKKNRGILLLDDKRARAVAEKEGVECYGTLALLKICREKEAIKKEELKPLLDKIIQKGNLYITPELYRWVLKK